MKLFTFGSKDIGIDLGTANILVTVKGKRNSFKRAFSCSNR